MVIPFTCGSPQILYGTLVRKTGNSALTGKYLVDIRPQSGITVLSKYSISDGCQKLPFVGGGVVQPGDVNGTSLAPLIWVNLDSVEALTESLSLTDADPSVDVVVAVEALEPKPPPSELLDRVDDAQGVGFREI